MAMVLGGVSCADEHPSSVLGTEPNSAEITRTGSIAMKLTGVDEAGNTYWLRGAEFLIQSVSDPSEPARTVSSDTDPTATAISVSLATGVYTVTLQGSWYLELQTAQGAQQVHPELDSSAVAEVTVSENQTSEVAFRFKVKRRGTLVIGIEVVFEQVDAAVGGSADAGRIDAGLDGGISSPVADAGAETDAALPTRDAGTDEEPEEADGGAEVDAGTTTPVLDAGGLDAEIVTTP